MKIFLAVHFNSGSSDSSTFFLLGTLVVGPIVFGKEYTVLDFHIACVYGIKSVHLELAYSLYFLHMSFQLLSVSVLDSILLL